MTIFQAFLLGIVQGLTEFLPVSSSAHLVFFQFLLGFSDPLVFFDVILHLGTLVALLIYFAPDLAHLVRDSVYGIFFLSRRKPLKEIFEIAPHSRWALGIIIASIPTALMGFLFKDWFESLFSSLQAVGLALFGTSAILWSTRYYQKGEKTIETARFLDFFLIGVLQGVAIIPGISRSGTTIAAALLLGLEHETAFRFSFLLAIPAILGAGLLEAHHGLETWRWGWQVLGVGFLVSAFFGYFSIYFLSKIVRKGKLYAFAFYTLAFGALVLAVSHGLE